MVLVGTRYPVPLRREWHSEYAIVVLIVVLASRILQVQ
eukprot:COSAG02_NODE_53298_length_302_cov_1.773399_1_plen_37_part_10